MRRGSWPRRLLAYLFTPAGPPRGASSGVCGSDPERRIHSVSLPLGGGVALFFAFWITVALLLRPPFDPTSACWLGSGSCFWWDGGRRRRLALVPEAPQANRFGIALRLSRRRIEFVTHPLTGETFHIGGLGIPLTLIWLIALTNMVNLIDGLDGLAAGIGHRLRPALFDRGQAGPPGRGADYRPFASAALGFLPYNFNPARIIMGDSGAMFLGFTLGAISVEAPSKEQRPCLRRPGPCLGSSHFGHPFFDAAEDR